MSLSTVLHRSFYSPALGAEKRYCICLPPSYGLRQDVRYSTLYLLPGLMDYERTWVDKGRIHEHLDRLLNEERIGELIVVMPDKDNAATDEAGESAFARYLAHDVIQHIDSTYRTIPVRHHRGIEGLSLGAGWTFRMLISCPQLFCSYGMLSGGFDDEAPQEFMQVREYLVRAGARFRVGVGLQEREALANNQAFVTFLRQQGFYAELDVMQGPHDWPLWKLQGYHTLQFHYYSFNPPRG